jgi:HEAT repeats
MIPMNPRMVVCTRKEATMTRVAPGLLTLILATVPLVAFADSYGPFHNFRMVDPTGRYYLVVKKNGGEGDPGRGTPITFEIAERRPGSPPVEVVHDRSKGFREVEANPEVKVRDGDIVLGKGSQERSPGRILISSTGLGFVGLDVSGYNYGSLRSGDALVVVEKNGTVRHRKNLIDLFSEGEIAQFMSTAGGVGWCGGGWIDEDRKEIVVVGSGWGTEEKAIPRLFRIVDMKTGNVRNGTAEVVLTVLSEANLGALDEALDLAAELKLDQAKPDLVKIFSDERLPIETRLRAAVALAKLGDRRGGELMRKVAFEDSGPSPFYAIKHLPAVLGDESAQILCDVIRRFGSKRFSPAWQAMNSVSGQAVVSPLLELLREDKPKSIDFAVECLGDKGHDSKAAVPDLLKLLDSEPKTENPLWTQQLAAIALGEIGTEAEPALASLIRLAERHDAEEWNNVKANQANHRVVNFGRERFASAYFVDAICKIRQK